MTDQQTVKISEAKGRPMLQWVGKRPLDYVTAFLAQEIERFDPAATLPSPSSALLPSPLGGGAGGGVGLLFHGDNKDVLAWLLAHGYRGKVNLIYIDPPFDSGADYVRRVQLRGLTGAAKLEGETYTLGEQIQYTDIWANDTYLQFMYERLLLLKEVLAEDGSLFLHCDWRMVHRLRLVLDEVLGAGNFINEISWKHTVLGGTHGRRLPKAHETLLWYSRGPEYLFNEHAKSARVEFGDYIKKTIRQDEVGRWFYTRGRMSRQPSAEEVAQKSFTTTYVDDPEAGTIASDVWDDLLAYRVYGDENTDYPTQKNESLVTRCVELGSSPGDLVLDCFAGSGTTAAVAQKLGRRWIASDINKGAVQTTSKRLQAIIRNQSTNSQSTDLQSTLPTLEDPDAPPPPASLAFTVYRVNDYDLGVQHNEAVNLAVEHVGIERLKTDVFFDGVLGKELVKIIPFNHPLTLLDLQLVEDELKARPGEERNVVLVCLGKETRVDAWLEGYNKHRPVNKLRVIELRTDQKYGRFLVHQPARAQVKIAREQSSGVSETPELLVVEIEDFISPTIVERLEMDTPLIKARIPDWRAMVDVVLIDTAFDGQVFNIVLSDVPKRRTTWCRAATSYPHRPARPQWRSRSWTC